MREPIAALSLATVIGCILLGCGGGDDGGSDPGEETTAAPAEPELGLEPTLAIMRKGNSERWCDFMTARFISYNWGGEPGRLGIKRCRYYSSRDDDPKDEAEIQVNLVKRSKRSAVAQISAARVGLYVGLLYDGHRWLIDGYSDSIGDHLQPIFQQRPRAVTEGVTAEELESFLTDAVPQLLEIECTEVPNEDLGDWACQLAVGDEPDVKRGTTIFSVAPKGTVSGYDVSGPAGSFQACCLEVSA